MFHLILKFENVDTLHYPDGRLKTHAPFKFVVLAI